jgi:pantoate--beta-alanine ligase
MLEIEQKYACAEFTSLEQRLAHLGAGPEEAHTEADAYFNAPDRDFVQTGEVFRLRRIGQANLFTYKGPRLPGAVKMRPELEIALGSGDEQAGQLTALLKSLGFRYVATVTKRRRSFPLKKGEWQLHVCLDSVEGVGSFAEVEILAPPEQAEQAQQVISQVADELGLHQVEPASYLTLYLCKHPQANLATGPKVAHTLAELKDHLAGARRQRHTVGLVPTMGALHAGHKSLIESARARNSFVVVSIFVNPTQFGPQEDLSRYPRTFETDLALCAECGVDLVFQPRPEEMYPAGFRTFVEVTGLQDVLEGAARPGHFRGVATVVLKLFNLVQPERAYFGQKDAQQARVIRQMVHDLNVPVEVVVLPTVREPDGLALSSRNRYLDAEQRRQAASLHAALTSASSAFLAGERDAGALKATLLRALATAPSAEVDYAAVVDPDSFAPLERVGQAALLALAVRFGATRLIDNLTL